MISQARQQAKALHHKQLPPAAKATGVRYTLTAICLLAPPLLWSASVLCNYTSGPRFATAAGPPGSNSSKSEKQVAVSGRSNTGMASTTTASSKQQACLVRPLVVLFGDSLTQYSFDPEGGWGAALAHHLQRKVDVVNRGHSGYNSRWGLKVFEQMMQQLSGQQVVLLTIWLGANDAAIPDRSAQVQHVPLAEYRSNLEAMVQMARQAGINNILLLTPPPVHDEGRIKHQQQKMGVSTPVPPDRSLEHAQEYAAAVLNLGKQLQLPVVDLFRRLQLVPDWQTQLLKDGLHFSTAGSMAVWQELKSVLETQLPELDPDSMPQHFPKWDDLDHANFEESWVTETLPKLMSSV